MADTDILHATCVAWGDRAVLIIGASGRGKSALGLQLMALGCVLVADDRVILRAAGAHLLAQCPPGIAGLIEARGAGILNADTRPEAKIALVVDLDQTEDQRLPDRYMTRIGSYDFPLVKRLDGPQFPAIILQILKSGWSDR